MRKGLYIKKQEGGRWSFDLTAGDGLVLCSSPVYETEAACDAAIRGVRACCQAPVAEAADSGGPGPKYTLRQEGEHRFTFRLTDAEGALLAEGPVFAADYTCLAGIRRVALHGEEAVVVVPTVMGERARYLTGQALNI